MMRIVYWMNIIIIVGIIFYNIRDNKFSFVYLFFPTQDYKNIIFEKRQVYRFLDLKDKINYTLVSLFNGPRDPFLEGFISKNNVEVLNLWIYMNKLILNFNQDFLLSMSKYKLNQRYLFLKAIVFSIFLSFDEIDRIEIYTQNNDLRIPISKLIFNKKDIYRDNKADILSFFLRVT